MRLGSEGRWRNGLRSYLITLRGKRKNCQVITCQKGKQKRGGRIGVQGGGTSGPREVLSNIRGGNAMVGLPKTMGGEG